MASFDITDNDADPTPEYDTSDNRHGTRCAGEVAAVFNNSVCSVGVAHGASIGGRLVVLSIYVVLFKLGSVS